MHFIKKNIIIPLVVFIIGMSAVAGIVCSINNEQNKQNRTMANLNAMTYAERIKTDIMKGIAVSDTLRQIIISDDGQINKFYEIAEEMMEDSVQSIQIAPDGVVTDIYPQKGNDAGKIDLLNDKDRGEICRYGRDNKVVTMQGPFQLKQGGYGVAVRNPVYIEENGHEDFWGFAIVIIRVPEIFADSMKALSDFGYNYTLYKTAFPWGSEFEEVYGSEEELKNPVSYTFDIGDSKWKLDIMPYETQSERIYLYAAGIGGIIIVLLLTGFTCALLVLDEHRKKFKKLAITDALTGIYNRHGYDERVTRYLKQNPDNHCVGVEFDIDDFKTINDMYVHRGMWAEYCDRVKWYDRDYPETDKTKWYVIGNSFGRDLVNIILESPIADKVEIGYSESLDNREHRLREVDVLFISTKGVTEELIEKVKSMLEDHTKLYVVGEKNFGENNTGVSPQV